VDNAFDSVAGPRNGGGVVELFMGRDGDALELAVLDNGPGIPVDVRAVMFDEGFTTKGTDAHAGIGLSLVQDAVVSAGGSIAVERDDGTVFRVRIPDAFVKTELLIP
jgi:two-component system CitB family sensor kinase